MLPQSFRLSSSQIQTLKNQAQTRHTPFFTVVYCPNSLNHPRFSLVVSAKLLRTAVSRNRLRRQIYSQLHHLLPHLPPIDALIIPKPPTFQLSAPKLNYHLHHLLSQLS